MYRIKIGDTALPFTYSKLSEAKKKALGVKWVVPHKQVTISLDDDMLIVVELPDAGRRDTHRLIAALGGELATLHNNK